MMLPLVWLLGCGAPDRSEAPRPEPVDDADVPAAEPDTLGPLTVDFEVDGTRTADGWLGVRATYRGVQGDFAVRKHGDGGAYTFRDVHYSGPNGKALGTRPKASRYEVKAQPVPSEVTVSYEVRPGVDGRHGHQGFSDDRFAVFDGRALLLPITEQTIERARFRFELPDGWTPATALVPQDDGWWVADPPAGSVLNERLLKECHGLGPWDRRDMVRGATEVRSFVHAELEDELRRKVHDDTEAVWGWFYDEVGFDPGYPMAFVRTPADRGERIFGGASMMGACYEAEWASHPDRNRYLLGHRFGHPFNKYPPVGLSPAGADEHWFTEGWASYAEVLAIEQTGRISGDSYFRTLWNVHRRQAGGKPQWLEFPMEREQGVGGEITEYLHYFRGPLLVKTLAFLVEERSDTDLEAFVRHLGREAGGHRRVYHLQQELEAFSGADLDDFWAAYVHGHTWVAPSYEEAVTADVRDRARAPMVARTAGYDVDARYLARLASTGRFHDVGALLDFVGREGPRRDALRRVGVQLVPDEVIAEVAGLSPFERESLARAEADWPVHALGRLADEVEPDLQWLDHDMADRWRRWAEADADDRAVTLAGGIDRIALRVGHKKAAEKRQDVLAVPADEPFTLYVWWREPRNAVRIEVLHDGELAWSVPVTEQPGWIRNRLVLDVADRPATSGLLTVRVSDADGELLGQQSFLQWAGD